MLPNLKLILTAPPDLAQAAVTFGFPVAHMAYRIGSGPSLLRSKLPVSLRGGLMLADDLELSGEGDPLEVCRQIMQECTARGFDGIILDFESAPNPIAEKIAAELSRMAGRKNWPVYVPETYAACSNRTKIIVSSALSGGSLTQRLFEATEKFGPNRVVLGVERLAEDFFLPAASGQGRPLTRETLQQYIAERNPPVFFSKELCASYFTFMSKQSGAHFVLFDNAASIRQKLQIAARFKIREAILVYPQVDDLLAELLG